MNPITYIYNSYKAVSRFIKNILEDGIGSAIEDRLDEVRARQEKARPPEKLPPSPTKQSIIVGIRDNINMKIAEVGDYLDDRKDAANQRKLAKELKQRNTADYIKYHPDSKLATEAREKSENSVTNRIRRALTINMGSSNSTKPGVAPSDNQQQR